MLKKQQKRYRRHRKVRAKIKGKVQQPRLCVFKSAKHICAQLIDDEKGKTILSASDTDLKKSPPEAGSPSAEKNPRQRRVRLQRKK